MFQAVPKFYHQEDDPKRKNSVVSTAFLVTTCFSGLACLLMASFSEPLSRVTFGDENYSIYVIMFSVLILTHALELYSLTYLRILKKPWTFFNFSMAKLALQLSLNITTIVYLDMGLMGLALSSLISSVAITIILTSYTLFKTGTHIDLQISKKIIKFSWPLWISGFIGLYIGSSNKYFIRVFSSLDEVGLYELAAKFGFIGMILVWNPFSQYWQTERFSVAKSEDPYPAYSLAFRLIASLLLVCGLGINLLSPPAIDVMSADEFHAAVNAIPFLVVASIFQSLTIFNNFSFMYTSRTFEITKNNIVTAVAISITYFLLIPSYGFVGAAIGVMIASIVQYGYALQVANKIYPLKISQITLIKGIFCLALITVADYMLVSPNFNAINILVKLGLSILGAALIVRFFFNNAELSKLVSAMRRT